METTNFLSVFQVLQESQQFFPEHVIEYHRFLVAIGVYQKLSRATFYPIKTWREFDEADPLRVLLGAFRGLEPGELLCLQTAQLVPLRLRTGHAEPSPGMHTTSRRARGAGPALSEAEGDVDFRMKAASAAGQARAGLFALAIILGSLDLAMLFASVGVFFRPSAGCVDVLKVVGGLGLLAAINAGLAIPAWRAWRRPSPGM